MSGVTHRSVSNQRVLGILCLGHLGWLCLLLPSCWTSLQISLQLFMLEFLSSWGCVFFVWKQEGLELPAHINNKSL